jgi:GR25 family glycosyltransferase involved in LPS biosynthesis
MRIHVINLDRSRDRLADFNTLNKHLTDIERYSAVDGAAQDIGKLVAAGTITPGCAKAYLPGAIGAALSHAALWTKAIETNEAITVCEDDAIFNFAYEPLAQEMMAALGSEWDFILWGWNFDAPVMLDLLPGVSPCIAVFDQNKMVANTTRFQSMPAATRPVRLLQCFGIPCYSVTPRGARALRDACIPIREAKIFFPGLNRELANFGIDVMMNAVYPNIRAFAAFPSLVVTKNEASKSTIQRRA